MKLHKIQKYNKTIFFGSASALVILALAMLFPQCQNGANAETQSLELTAALTVKPTIAVSVDSAVSMAIDLKQPVMSTSGTANVNVTTNDRSGYQLFINSVNSPNMVLSSESGEVTGVDNIAALSTNAVLGSDAWPVNSWGYYIGSAAPTSTSVFKGLTTTAALADNKTSVAVATSNVTSYKLAFGVKVDSRLKSGVYSNRVIVSALSRSAVAAAMFADEIEESAAFAINNADSTEDGTEEVTEDAEEIAE